MKPIFSILLAILTLAFTLNLGVAYHYCGGKLAASEVVVGHGSPDCGMEGVHRGCAAEDMAIKKIPCCDDQLIQFNTDDYQAPVWLVNFFSCTIPAVIHSFSFTAVKDVQQHFPLRHAPPDLTAVSLSVIGVFLI